MKEITNVERTRRSLVRKVQEIRMSSSVRALLGYLLHEDWSEPKITLLCCGADEMMWVGENSDTNLSRLLCSRRGVITGILELCYRFQFTPAERTYLLAGMPCPENTKQPIVQQRDGRCVDVEPFLAEARLERDPTKIAGYYIDYVFFCEGKQWRVDDVFRGSEAFNERIVMKILNVFAFESSPRHAELREAFDIVLTLRPPTWMGAMAGLYIAKVAKFKTVLLSCFPDHPRKWALDPVTIEELMELRKLQN